jgi:hypothetical protein
MMAEQKADQERRKAERKAYEEKMMAEQKLDQEKREAKRKTHQEDLQKMMNTKINAKMDTNQVKAAKQEETLAEISARMDVNTKEINATQKKGTQI